jgi:hypothetical protein
MKLGIGLSLTRQRILGSDFSPSDISNLDLWYDFSTISGSNGDAQASFTNAGLGGSNYNLAQSTAGSRPTLDTSELSLNSLDFDGDRFDLDNAYLTTGKTFSIFIVYEVDATADVDTFIAGSTGGNNQFGVYNHKNVTTRFNADATGDMNSVEYIRTDQTTQDAGYGGSATSTTAYTLTANPEILVLTRGSDNEIKIYNKAGALIGLSTSTTNNHEDTNFQIDHIGGQSGGASPNNGVIGEMGVYNKTLSASEVSDLITHLADKWSIS